jgi:hypothetical protein
LIQAFDVFEIVAIGRKTWGKIPMSIIHKTFQTKADERCPGILFCILEKRPDSLSIHCRKDYEFKICIYLK